MNLPALLAFICGFASLSLEILWVRLYGFANTSTPAAFGFVLCAYLIGIALGARVGARSCGRADDATLWRRSVQALLLSALLTFVLPALLGAVTQAGVHHPLIDLATITAASSVLSFVFPIAHHLGTRHAKDKVGRRFATVYTANVMGAALGPLVTGYVLLDHASLQTSFLIVGVLQALAAVLLVLALGIRRRRPLLIVIGALLAGSFSVVAATLDPHRLVQAVTGDAEIAKTVVENRHGIITIFPGKDGDDLVYGGNVYDGRTNLSPDHNTNGLQRPLLMATLHPAPRRVLMVGLSIGTWLAIAKQFPGVEQVDVVEINPGYLQAMRDYPVHAASLTDPRVRVVVDDARRWLRMHPERRYDLVIMNTTLHWRSNTSLLLSREVLQVLKAHMAPGAVLSFNATGSGDAFFTATQVFAHAYRYMNFVYAADFDFRSRKDEPRAREVYAGLRVGGEPLFAPGSTAVAAFLQQPFVTIQSDQGAPPARPFELITDDNMITEFKYGRPLYNWLDFVSF